MISAAPLVNTVTRDLLKKLEEKAPPRKRAPRMLSAFLPALERLVVDKDMEPSIRAGAWVKLLKVWASLRFDDVAHMKPEMLRMYDKKLSGLMKRTKTSGGGKRVKELPFHVSDAAWIEHKEWLQQGMDALGSMVEEGRELLVPAGTSCGEPEDGSVMAYQEAVAWSADVMQAMKDWRGEQLIPHGWERYWTTHADGAPQVAPG